MAAIMAKAQKGQIQRANFVNRTAPEVTFEHNANHHQTNKKNTKIHRKIKFNPRSKKKQFTYPNLKSNVPTRPPQFNVTSRDLKRRISDAHRAAAPNSGIWRENIQ